MERNKRVMKKTGNYKNVINETDKNGNNLSKILSILLFVMVIIYMILPINVGEGVLGRVEDFFFFMASFVNMYACCMNKNQFKAIVLLKLISLILCVLGALALFVLIFIGC